MEIRPPAIRRRDFLKGLAAASLPAFGLPTTTTGRGRVLIIGAGLSGMVAALELRNAGHQVTILEATARPGGRVHTLREPFSDGLYAEAGAGRIPSTHDLTLKYVHQFGLQLVPFYPTSGSTVYYFNGSRSLVGPGFDKQAASYLGDACREVGQIRPDQWPTPAVLKRYGSITIEAFLRNRGASQELVDYIVSGYQAEAALDFLRDLSSHQAPSLSKIVGGNDLLPRAFAARLATNIVYGAQAVRLEQNARSVSVTFLQSGSMHTLEADYLICAIPFTVLRTLEVKPAFSDRKREAIRSMTYGAVSRVFLQTRTKFWREAGNSGFAVVDKPMELWNPTWNQGGVRGLLMAYTYENFAREIAAQPEDERTAKMLAYFNLVHPGMNEAYELGASWVWDEQPYAKGAYCFYLPGQFDTMLPAAMQPEKRILFAGEHCSSHPAWMQGALESGLNAAKMVERAYL